MADAGFSAFVESFTFVTEVLKIWDNIEKQMHNEARTTQLAQQLHALGLEDLRDDIKISLEETQRILRDRTIDSSRRERLLRESGRFYNLLKKVQDAVEDVLKDSIRRKTELTAAHGRGDNSGNSEGQVKPQFRKRHILGALMPNRSKNRHPSPQQVLDTTLAEFQQAMGEFNTLAMRISRLTESGERQGPMHLRETELQYIGQKRPTGNGLTTLAKASYLANESSEAIEKDVIVESLPYKIPTKDAVTEAACTLGAKLHPALASSFIPSLLGYRVDTEEVELVFERPLPGREFVSLAQLYDEASPEPSLNVRVTLCRQLAVAVLQTHALGLVHKEIRPENLLVAVERESDSAMITDAVLYLCGWENARMLSTASKRVGASTPMKLIYHHPQRYVHKGVAKKRYEIKHDIYSLGVCALEILTWDVLIRADGTLSAAYQTSYEAIDHNDNVDSGDDDDGDDNDNANSGEGESRRESSIAMRYTRHGGHVQETLVAMATQNLPRKAGDRMAELVCRCLDPQPIVEGADSVQISDNIADDILADMDNLLSAL